MSNSGIDTEVKYCTLCGAANKKSATVCVECEEELNKKYRPFYDFLKKRVKGKIVGGAQTGIFGLLKNFLVSHLYGTVLAVSVVATSSVALATATPYIKVVSTPEPAIEASVNVDNNVVEEVKEDITKVTEEQTEEVKEEIKEEVKEEIKEEATASLDSEEQRERIGNADYVASHYYDRVMEKMYAHEGYTCDSDTLKLSQIYAENNISGYNFSKVHDMMTKSIPLGMYDETGISYEILGFWDNTFKYDASVTSATAKNLYNAGFKVMEASYHISAYRTKSDYTNNPSNPQEQEVYRIVLVEQNGEWYIAEDVLISRVKGQTYDVYMKYGANGIVSYDSEGNVEYAESR